MALILSVVNQKGGVGKTTTAVNLGAYLARRGKFVLLIDLDPQCNATSGLGIDHKADRSRLYRNRGDGTFEDITAESGAGVGGTGMGCAAMDYDRDGDVDIYTQFNVKPASNSWICRPFSSSGNETCTAASPAAGTPNSA